MFITILSIFFFSTLTTGLTQKTINYNECKSQDFKGTIGSNKIQCSNYRGLSEFDKD